MFVQALRSEYRSQDHGSFTSSSQETSLTKDAFSHIELSAKRRNALFLHPDNDEQAEEHKAFLNDVQYRYLNPNVHKASTTPQDVVLDHRLSRAGQTAEFLSRLPRYIAPEVRGGTNSQAGGQGSTRAKTMKRASTFEADQTPVVPRSDNRKGNRILKLDDVSDLLYPNIDVSRQRQPSALMLVAGVGSKQKTPSSQQGSLLQEDALRNTSDALNETLIRPRVVGAAFSAPSYAPSKQQPADSSKQRHPVLGSNSSGSVLKATGLVEQLPETPQYEVVLPSAPAARFSKAPRWSQAPKSEDHEKDTVHSFPGPQDSAERRGLQEAFDAAAAYNAVLPRVAAAWFSKTKRFKDAGDDWQQQERCQPKLEEYCLPSSTEWSQGVDPSGKPSLLMSKKGVRNKASVVATDSVGDVEAAKDFIKPRKPVASFGHTSVKEAMLKEIEKRKRTVQERLHAQEKRKETIKGCTVIGSGSLGEEQGPQVITELMNATSTASPSVLGNTASFEQPSSPDRMLNHRRGTQAPSHLSLSHGVDACDGANNISHIGSNKWDGGVLDWLKRSYSAERERVAGRSISPRWELLQKRVTTPSFSGYASRSVSVGGAMPGAPMRSEMVGRYSRRPGPGSYLHAEDAHASLSYVARPPSTTIPRAQLPRFLMEGETGSAWQPTAAALEMWSQADPGAAKDRLRPRAPGVVIGTELRLKVDPVPHADDEAQVGGGGVTDFQLQIRYDLVEPRLIGLVNMRASLRQALVVNQLPAESNSGVEGVEDPWALDQAVRVLKPSWSFKAASRWAAAEYDRELVRRQRDLEPNYSFGRHRVQGIPNFAAFLTSRSRLGKGAVWREPAVGAYDLERAWHFLAMHVPARIMAAAEDRWRLPSRAALERGGDQMVLELSQALALVQPQAPAWSFAPVPTSVRRVHEVQTIMSHLEVEFAVAFVKRRTPGMPTFEHQMGRVLKAEEQKLLEEMSRLGPGAYEPRHGCIERRATTFPFEKYLDHGIFSSDEDEEDLSAQGGQNKGHTMLEELPEGARLRLDVLSAKDATLRRTKFVVIMKGMPGRDDVLASSHVGIPHGGYTNHLPLPDPELDLLSSTRRRVHQVDLSGLLGHQPLVQHDPEDVRRGPGMYHLADNFTLAGARGPAWDFGKLMGRSLDNLQPDNRDGDRLDLEPEWQLNRPSAPHAVIQSEHSLTNVKLAERRNQERLYQSAVYLYSLDMVRPVPPRPPTFHLSSGRRCDSTSNPSQTYLLDYHVEDIPLTVLAGYRRAPTGPDFHTNLPHASALPISVDFSGQVLDLEVESALDMTRPSAPRAADMSKTLSRIVHDPDSELTAWLDYEPKMIQVKPAPSAVPNMTHALDRNRAALLDPRVGQSATGDLDAGVYSARYSLMLPTAPSVDFKSATERSLGYAGDEEQGNVLMLHPELPKGWQQKTEDDPDRQPFGRKHVRWADASVGNEDEGNMLQLRNSQNDLARLQNRVTLPSAPAAAFGDMTSRRDDVVLQPDPAIPPRPRILQRWVSKIETSLQHHPPSDLAMEILLHEPDDPRVKELKRRHRVWQRLAKKLEQIQMEGAAAELIQHPPAWPEQQSSPGNVHPGFESDRHPSKAAEYAVAQKAQAYRVQQQRIQEQRKQRAEGLKDAGAVHVRPFPWQPEVEQPLPLSAVEVTRAPLGVRPRDEHLMKKIQKEQALAAEAVRETHWLSRRPWGSEDQGETLADRAEGLKHAMGGETTGRVLKPLEIPLAQLRASKFTAGANAGRTEGMQKKGWGRLRHKLVNEKLRRPQWGVTYES